MSMDNVIGDIRYAARVLRRNPVFTAVAILTLALGIGANTAVFNVMNAVLLRYLPVSDPERVVYLRVEGRPSGTWETGDDSLTFNEPAFEQMRGEQRVLSDLRRARGLSNPTIPPDVEHVETLFAFCHGTKIFPVHIDTISTVVDLRCAKI